MFKHILVPIDQSRCAQGALVAALQLARASKASLTVCHVVDLTKISATLVDVGGSGALPLDLVETSGTALLEDARWEAKSFGVSTETRLLYGAPVASIAAFATESGVDLIVMGSHGLSGLARLLLGSVTQGVLRSAETPVIVIREERESSRKIDGHISFKRILAAYDGSVYADRALEVAAELVLTAETELSICYVVDLTKTLNIVGTAYFAADSVIDGITAQGEAALERASIRKNGERTKTYLRSGYPADEIVACGHEISADLIVLGSHGRSGISRLLFGSVAEAVLRQSNIPVFIVGGMVQNSWPHADARKLSPVGHS